MIPDTRIFSLDGSSTSAPGIVDFSRIGTKWMIDATIPAHLSENERKNFEPAFYNNVNSVILKTILLLEIIKLLFQQDLFNFTRKFLKAERFS